MENLNMDNRLENGEQPNVQTRNSGLSAPENELILERLKLRDSSYSIHIEDLLENALLAMSMTMNMSSFKFDAEKHPELENLKDTIVDVYDDENTSPYEKKFTELNKALTAAYNSEINNLKNGSDDTLIIEVLGVMRYRLRNVASQEADPINLPAILKEIAIDRVAALMTGKDCDITSEEHKACVQQLTSPESPLANEIGTDENCRKIISMPSSELQNKPFINGTNQIQNNPGEPQDNNQPVNNQPVNNQPVNEIAEQNNGNKINPENEPQNDEHQNENEIIAKEEAPQVDEIKEQNEQPNVQTRNSGLSALKYLGILKRLKLYDNEPYTDESFNQVVAAFGMAMIQFGFDFEFNKEKHTELDNLNITIDKFYNGTDMSPDSEKLTELTDAVTAAYNSEINNLKNGSNDTLIIEMLGVMRYRLRNVASQKAEPVDLPAVLKEIAIDRVAALMTGKDCDINSQEHIDYVRRLTSPESPLADEIGTDENCREIISIPSSELQNKPFITDINQIQNNPDEPQNDEHQNENEIIANEEGLQDDNRPMQEQLNDLNLNFNGEGAPEIENMVDELNGLKNEWEIVDMPNNQSQVNNQHMQKQRNDLNLDIPNRASGNENIENNDDMNEIVNILQEIEDDDTIIEPVDNDDIYRQNFNENYGLNTMNVSQTYQFVQVARGIINSLNGLPDPLFREYNISTLIGSLQNGLNEIDQTVRNFGESPEDNAHIVYRQIKETMDSVRTLAETIYNDRLTEDPNKLDTASINMLVSIDNVNKLVESYTYVPNRSKSLINIITKKFGNHGGGLELSDSSDDANVKRLEGLLTMTFEEFSQTMHAVENNKQTFANSLHELRLKLDETGSTWFDSRQFGEFKRTVTEIDDRLSSHSKNNSLNSIIIADMNNMFDRLKNSADDYYFAKLGQSHNTRRAKRFDIAAQIRAIVQKAKSEISVYGMNIEIDKKELEMRKIADKNAYANALARKQTEKLNTPNMIYRDADNIIKSGEENGFVVYNTMSEQELYEISKKSASDITKDLGTRVQQLSNNPDKYEEYTRASNKQFEVFKMSEQDFFSSVNVNVANRNRNNLNFDDDSFEDEVPQYINQPEPENKNLQMQGMKENNEPQNNELQIENQSEQIIENESNNNIIEEKPTIDNLYSNVAGKMTVAYYRKDPNIKNQSRTRQEINDFKDAVKEELKKVLGNRGDAKEYLSELAKKGEQELYEHCKQMMDKTVKLNNNSSKGSVKTNENVKSKTGGQLSKTNAKGGGKTQNTNSSDNNGPKMNVNALH